MGTTDHARHAAADSTLSTLNTVQTRPPESATWRATRHTTSPTPYAAHRRPSPSKPGQPAGRRDHRVRRRHSRRHADPRHGRRTRAGQHLKDNSGELTDRVRDIAADIKDDLSEPVQQAVGQVKDTAQDAAQTTKDQAEASAVDVKEQTRQAAQKAF